MEELLCEMWSETKSELTVWKNCTAVITVEVYIEIEWEMWSETKYELEKLHSSYYSGGLQTEWERLFLV